MAMTEDYLPMDDYSYRIRELFDSQIKEWPLAGNNYRQLANVKTRKISFTGYDIILQFNPGRITSSAAKVDDKSVKERPCFLCKANRPSEQKGISFGNGYTALVNPFPIFARHLTIVSDQHTPQRIAGNFGTMLTLAKALPDYILFYNGPQCGASAPDHLHFQAGNKGFLPLEKDALNTDLCSITAATGETELWQWKNYGRGIITLRSGNMEETVRIFDRFCSKFALMQPERPEPMLNILACYVDSIWTVHIISRKLHRPACYFAGGDDKILLSPASVDLGGVFITPREEDFNIISEADVKNILNEVCFSDKELLPLIRDLI